MCQRRDAELPVFMEVFKALPEGELDYKPADDSPSAKEIAWIMTRQLKSCNEIIKDGKTGWDDSEPPSWDQVLASSRSTVGSPPSNGWEGTGHLRAVRGCQAKEHGDDKLNFSKSSLARR
jgi:hypothetical protein